MSWVYTVITKCLVYKILCERNSLQTSEWDAKVNITYDFVSDGKPLANTKVQSGQCSCTLGSLVRARGRGERALAWGLGGHTPSVPRCLRPRRLGPRRLGPGSLGDLVVHGVQTSPGLWLPIFQLCYSWKY